MASKKAKVAQAIETAKPLKLNLGCGDKRHEDFIGVDIRTYDRSYPGMPENTVDIVADLTKPWPWADDSVDECISTHFLEHLDGNERIHFANELYRVLKPGGFCTLLVPHWASAKAYGDMTHKWPPMSEFWFYYLSKNWREQEAQDTARLYTCDFDTTWGYSLRPDLNQRNQEMQAFAMGNYRDAIVDIQARLTKKVPA